jgi:hypothetical protein
VVEQIGEIPVDTTGRGDEKVAGYGMLTSIFPGLLRLAVFTGVELVQSMGVFAASVTETAIHHGHYNHGH